MLNTAFAIQVVRATNFTRHPEWNGDVMHGFDVAVVRLSRPVENVSFPVLSQGDELIRHGMPAVALGWGQGGPSSSQQTGVLQMAKLTIISHDCCPRKLQEYLKPHMICTYAPDQNVCPGIIIYLSHCIHRKLSDLVQAASANSLNVKHEARFDSGLSADLYCANVSERTSERMVCDVTFNYDCQVIPVDRSSFSTNWMETAVAAGLTQISYSG